MSQKLNMMAFEYKKETAPLDWALWKSIFRAYVGMAQLRFNENDDQDEIKHTLIACVGFHAVNTMSTLGPDWDTNKTYDELIAVLDERYGRTAGLTNEMAFENLSINDGEDLEDYLYRCKQMAAVANLTENDIKKKLLKDTSIHKLPNGGAIIDMCLKTDTSFEHLLTWARRQDIKESLMNKTIGNSLSLNEVRSRVRSTSSQNSNSSNSSAWSQDSNRKQICWKCNRRDFPHENECLASNKICFDCQVTGHFKGARACKNPSQQTLDARKNRQEARNVRNISAINHVEAVKRWECPKQIISIGLNKLKFKPDTAADCNVMTHQTYSQMIQKPVLHKSNAILMPFDGIKPIPVLGEFSQDTTWQGKTRLVKFIVVDNTNNDLTNLLSYETMIEFNVDFNKMFYDFRKSPMHNSVSHQIETIRCSASKLNCKTSSSKFAIQQHAAKLRDRIKLEYKDLFEDRTGCVPNVRINFEIDENIKPIRVPPRLIPVRLLSATKAKLDKWESEGVIKKITYQDHVSFVSALNPVEKAESKSNQETATDVRLTLDCRHVNKAIVRQKCTMLPDQRQIEYDLENAKIFSKIDIKDAFSTLQLDENSADLFTFSTPWGLYRLNRLVQGVSVSSELYHDFITDKFKDIEFVRTCIDDFLVYGKPNENLEAKDELASALENHDKALYKTLERCRALNLTLNEKKCQFGEEEVTFFGQKISPNGFKPIQEKLDALKQAKAPTNKTEMKSFLGMCASVHRRLPDLANESKLLRDLTKKHAIWNWTTEHETAMNKIKDSLIEYSLAHFEKQRHTELFVDAGPHGISAILTQLDEKGNRWLNACASHAFTETEDRFAQVEKEMLALVWGSKHFYLKLVANDNYSILTDNEAICKMLTRENPPSSLRIASWLSRLPAGTASHVKHIKGEMNIADYLSRCLNTDKATEIEDMHTIYSLEMSEVECSMNFNLNSITLDTIVAETNRDQNLIEAKEFIKNKRTMSKQNNLRTLSQHLSLNNRGLVMFNDRIVLPQSLENSVIDIAHEGHLGVPKIIDIIKKRYFFSNLRAKVLSHARKCQACVACTGSTNTEPQIIQALPESAWRNHQGKISIDFSSKTPSNSYILVIVCNYSRYPIMKISKTMTCKEAIMILRKVFKEFGVPKIIMSDNGPAFSAHAFASFAKEMGFVHEKKTPLYPSANGIVESKMKLINKSIRSALILKQNWQVILDAAIKKYRATTHPMTGQTPNSLMNLPDEINLPSLYIENQFDPQSVLDKDYSMRSKIKHFSDKDRKAKHIEFKIGDTVLHQWPRTNKYQSKFDPNPFKVIDITGAMITVKRPHHNPVTRNSSFFKKIFSIQTEFFCFMVNDPLQNRRAKAIEIRRNRNRGEQNIEHNIGPQQQLHLTINNKENESLQNNNINNTITDTPVSNLLTDICFNLTDTIINQEIETNAGNEIQNVNPPNLTKQINTLPHTLPNNKEITPELDIKNVENSIIQAKSTQIPHGTGLKRTPPQTQYNSNLYTKTGKLKNEIKNLQSNLVVDETLRASVNIKSIIKFKGLCPKKII